MFGNYYKQNISFKDKVLSLDYALILLIIILGVVSVFAMYSTERGNFDYYTKSHIYRFLVFFIIFLILSFLNIRIWFKSAYIFYFIVLLLLIGVSLFGVTASGSTRWINLFIFNLQPSELMKVALIIFLARFYNKIPFKDVNHIKFMIIPIFALFIPFALVLKQPDLGTAVLILISGLSVVWLSGFRIKFFAFSSIILVCLAPVVIAFLKPYQKLRILSFLLRPP